MSAAGRCASSGTNGCRAPRRCSRNSPAICPLQEPTSWLAGGKRMLLDRIEWIMMPDPNTAAAALQKGEVDWWEDPISDLIPVLRKKPDGMVDIGHPFGRVGSFRLDHLHPPLNYLRAR